MIFVVSSLIFLSQVYNVMKVHVERVMCVGVTADEPAPRGIELQLSGKDGLSWIRNVLVSDFDGTDKLNVVAFTTEEDFVARTVYRSHQREVQVHELRRVQRKRIGSSCNTPEPHHPPLTALDEFSDVNGVEQYAINL
jgi:hypothetical protein